MKKLFVILLGIISFCTFNSCERNISPDKLPQQAKQLVAANFPGVDILSVRKDGLKYDAVLFDGTEIEFRHNGQWNEVDCGMNPVPTGILPANIAKYVTARFPMNFVTHIKYDHKRYEVELENDLDLLFDKNGNFIGADD